MNKKIVIVIFVCFLLINISTAYAFSLQDIFSAINSFFDRIFGREAVGGPQIPCDCGGNIACSQGYFCEDSSINGCFEEPDKTGLCVLIPECEDGEDNDGDGFIDGQDYGCVITPEDELNPNLQCDDGIDNDGDGLIDYPDDLGCENIFNDNDETDLIDCTTYNTQVGCENNGCYWCDIIENPICVVSQIICEDLYGGVVPGQVECNDGIDNDGDGEIDLDDSGCNPNPTVLDNDESDCGDHVCEGSENIENCAIDCVEAVAEFYVDNVKVEGVEIGDDYVNNGDFEDGLTNWGEYYPGSISIFEINTNAVYSKSGNSLRVESIEDYKGARQYVNLEPDTLYRYSVDVYVVSGRVALTFWGDDRASKSKWITDGGTGWYHLENYMLTHSGSGSGANNPNNEVVIYSWPDEDFEICDNNVDDDNDNLIDCSDGDCEDSKHYEEGVEKWKCDNGIKHELDFNDSIDNDGDGVKDKLDNDCGSYGGDCSSLSIDNILTYQNKIEFNQYSKISLIECHYTLTGESDSDSVKECIDLNVSDVPCVNKNIYFNSNYVKFTDCYVGEELGEKSILCYVGGECGGSGSSNFLPINITEFEICDNGEVGVDEISILGVEGIQDEYDLGEDIEIEVEVKNSQSSSNVMDARVEAWLVNVDKSIVEEEVTSEYKEIDHLHTQVFELNLTIPNDLSLNNTYRLYIKAYKKNKENSMCVSDDYLINLLEGECEDEDDDGYSDENCGGSDCDDSDEDINPGENEICDDGLDNDCDGFTDFADTDCGATGECVESWNCGPWEPTNEECRVGETQTRTCVDIYDCGTSFNKPKESQTCGEAYSQIDSDNDGLPDDWEYAYFGNLNSGPNDDPDGDGMTNAQEYASNTHPLVSDKLNEGGGLWTVLIVSGVVIFIAVIVVLLYFKFARRIEKEKIVISNEGKLVNYIRECRQRGLSDDVIRKELLKTGWKREDINKYL